MVKVRNLIVVAVLLVWIILPDPIPVVDDIAAGLAIIPLLAGAFND